MERQLTDRSHWLELHLYQLASVLAPEGHRAMLYCGACEAEIPYGDAAAGPIQDWPYCPDHQKKPLMICSTSLHLPSLHLQAHRQAESAQFTLETNSTMQYSGRPPEAEQERREHHS